MRLLRWMAAALVLVTGLKLVGLITISWWWLGGPLILGSLAVIVMACVLVGVAAQMED